MGRKIHMRGRLAPHRWSVPASNRVRIRGKAASARSTARERPVHWLREAMSFRSHLHDTQIRVLVTGAGGEMGMAWSPGPRHPAAGAGSGATLDCDPGLDILDRHLLERIRSEFEIPAVFHLAPLLSTRAEGRVRRRDGHQVERRRWRWGRGTSRRGRASAHRPTARRRSPSVPSTLAATSPATTASSRQTEPSGVDFRASGSSA